MGETIIECQNSAEFVESIYEHLCGHSDAEITAADEPLRLAVGFKDGKTGQHWLIRITKYRDLLRACQKAHMMWFDARFEAAMDRSNLLRVFKKMRWVLKRFGLEKEKE